MSEPGSASEISKILSSATISIVDKAWEISWATRIIFIILFLDMFLLTTRDGGLLSWAQGSKPNINLAGALLFGASLCFVAAYLLPAMIFIIKTISLGLLIRFSEKPDRHPDYVLDHLVLAQAIENDNKFMLDWYLYNREREISRDARLRDLSDLLFGFLLIASLNFCFGYWRPDLPSVLYDAAMKSGTWGQATLLMSGMVIFLFVMQSWANFRYPYIFHPPIARSIADEREKLHKHRAHRDFR